MQFKGNKNTHIKQDSNQWADLHLLIRPTDAHKLKAENKKKK